MWTCLLLVARNAAERLVCRPILLLGVEEVQAPEKEEKAKTELLPAADGFGADQAGVVVFGAVAHAQRVPVSEVGGDVPVIGDGDVRAFFSEADVVAVVFVAMREQTDTGLFAASDNGEHHGMASER